MQAPRRTIARLIDAALLIGGLAGLLLGTGVVRAEDVVAYGQPMRFANYNRDDGLSQSAVNRIVQDATGFMWFATESGLNRFDGYEFDVYRHVRGDVASLPNDFITDINSGFDGDLWIATDGGGIVRRRAKTIELVHFRRDPSNDASLVDDHIRKIVADPRGWVWIGTMRDGLSRLEIDSGRFESFRHDENDATSLSDDRVHAIWLDPDGTVWVGTGAGLDRFDVESGVFERFAVESGAGQADRRILSIFRDSRGDLWIGTAQQGLARFDEAGGTFDVFRHDATNPRSLASDRVEVVYEDSSGRLWVGTNDGLHLMSDDRRYFTRYRHDPTDPSSLSDSYIMSIYEDRTGVLWVGTKTGGVNKWNARSWLFGHFKPESSSSIDKEAPKATSFTRDSQGRLWVGTFGSGILVLDEQLTRVSQLRRQTESDAGLSDDVVMALLTDDQGYIWAGTMHGGLNRIDPESGAIQVFTHDAENRTSVGANGIMSLFKDSRGTVWVGTFGGGVSRYDAATDSFFNYPSHPADLNSLSNPNATAIAEDADGAIWVATSGGGLNRLRSDGETWEHFLHDPEDSASLSGNAVYSLHVDAKGTLWAGTRSGLNRYIPRSNDGGSFQTISQSDGLANDVIYGIHSDAEGRLWLSTNYGLNRFDPVSGRIRHFHVSDGLQDEEFNFGAHFSDSRGTLYFGGINGFNAFDPMQLEFSAAPPTVVLTGITKFNEPAHSAVTFEFLDNMALDYTEDMVTLEFAALDYTAPSRNQYAYKLEGFDRDWVQAGVTRRATYTDLPGGNYVFRVRGANSDGVWNDADIDLKISVQPPPWQRPWAYGLYLLGSMAIIFGIYRVQERKLEREAEYSRRLETEVQDRTSDLEKSNADLQDANKQLREASLTDALTGLRNRRFLFEEVLKDVELVRRKHDPRYDSERANRDLVFVMVDLDHFKPINDSCGHIAGDRVLLQVRDVLRSACRASDIVIRWGGDEFLIVGRETTHDDASILAERVRSDIANKVFSVGNGQVARTTCSIGFASFPFIPEMPELLTWEQVLGVADMAMYRAKEERNAWVGIHGQQWERSSDSLYQAMQADLVAVEAEGVVRLERSLSLRDSRTA